MSGVWALLEPAARPIVAMLFNGLWQGAIIALAVWAMLRIFPNANASTRYAAWSAALLAVLVVPLITTIPRVSAGYAVAATTVAQTATHAATGVVRPDVAAKATHHVAATSATVAPAPAPWSPPRLSVPAWLAIGLFGLWGLAAFATLLRLVLSLVQLERLKTDALPLGVEYRDVMARWTAAAKGSREVRICVSNDIEVPVAVGLFDAMILLPKHLLDRLESHEIDQISLHELAHLRRADDWTNGLQRIAQALLFFNPAVAFIAHQMDIEREVACDDWVLAVTGDVRPYAFCLTKMAEVTAWPHRALAAPGAFVTRKNISVRIERLLVAKRVIGSAVSPGASSAVLAALIAAFFVLRTVTPSIAYTSPPSPDHAYYRVASEPPASKNSPAPHRPAASPAPTERPPSVVPGGPRTVAYVSITKTDAPRTHHVAKTIAPAVSASAASAGAAIASSASAHAVGMVDSAMAIARTSMAHVAMPVALSAFSCLGCDMHGVVWPGRDLHGVTMTGADFHGADLHGANLSHANLTGIDLRDADLRNASFVGASLEGCDLTGARLDGANFSGASLTGCKLDVSKLSGSQALTLLKACTGCDFHGADLRNRDLRGIALMGVDLAGADLRGADLSNASFTGVDFTGVRLAGAKLDRASFVGCDFRKADLRNVDLSRATMTGSSLSDAIMR